MNKKNTQTIFKKLIIKHRKIGLLALLFFVLSSVHAQFVHPGVSHKQSDLERMKYMVEAQIDPWYTSYQNMVADSKSSFDYAVRGDLSFTTIARDPPRENYNQWNDDIRAAYYNAIRWFVEGDIKHAEKAVEIFNAWVNIKNVTSNGTSALSGGVAYIMIEAAEIIKHTSSSWSDADRAKFEAMLVYPGYSSDAEPSGVSTKTGSFYWQAYQGDPVRHGNQGLSGFRTVMAMGIFLDNEIMYDRALRNIQGLPNSEGVAHNPNDIPYPSGPHTRIQLIDTNEFADSYSVSKNTNSLDIDYGFNEVMTNYIFDNGQCQESSRDHQHTAFGMGLLTSMAEMAWNQGDDLYSHANDRLLLGLEYNMRYNVSAFRAYPDQMTPWNPTVASGEFKTGFDRTGRFLSKTMSTALLLEFNGTRTVFETPVAHYLGRGFKTEEEVKWIQRARDLSIEVSGFEKSGFTNDAIGWGGLTFRRPQGCYGDPISGFDSNGLPVYAMNIIPLPIEAENFDYDPVNNGQGRVYNDLSTSNTGGAYRILDDVDVELTAGGGHHITSIESGEWLTYTIAVPERAEYNIVIRYAASAAGGTIGFNIAGEDKTGDVDVPFGAPNSTSNSDWKDYIIADNIVLEEGVQSLKVFFGGTSGTFKLDNLTLTKTGRANDNQSISFFTVPHKVLGSADFNPGAVASSGLDVTYSSSDPAIATIVDGKVHLVGTGIVVITASQIGDSETNPAPDASQDLHVINTVTSTLSLGVDADTYVQENKANDNFGTSASMVTKAGTSSRYAYLKFDLSSVPGPIISAKFKMSRRTSNGDNEERYVYDVVDDSWTETGLTWANKPDYINERARLVTKSGVNEWDVSSYVAQEYGGDKIITMAVDDPDNPSTFGIDFVAKENGSNVPELVIEYEGLPLNVKTERELLDIYPNPILNELNVSLGSANLNISETNILLFDLNGRQIMQLTPSTNQVKLNLSKLNSGVYLLIVKDESKNITRKIVKL